MEKQLVANLLKIMLDLIIFYVFYHSLSSSVLSFSILERREQSKNVEPLYAWRPPCMEESTSYSTLNCTPGLPLAKAY